MSTREIFHTAKDLHDKTSVGKINGMMFFGEKLRQWRESKGVTLYRLAKITGISQPNLTSIEKGRRPPSDEVLQKLADVPELEISYKQLRAWQILEKATPEELDCLRQELERL